MLAMEPNGTPARLSIHLIRGDCLEVIPRLAAKGIQAHLVFADLPYGRMTENVWDVPIRLESLWGALRIVSATNAAIVMTSAQPFTSQLVISQPKLFRYELIWHKTRATNFLNANKMPLRAHENVLVFYKQLPTYNPQKTTGLPYARKDGMGGADSANYGARPSRRSRIDRTNMTGARHPTTVQQFVQENATVHPTQKPVTLLMWLIRTYSDCNQTIIDPVSGSATTAIAAIRTGRNAVCIEKDRNYFDIGVKRVKAEIAASGISVDLQIDG